MASDLKTKETAAAPSLRVEREGGVATIVLDRPAVLNALNQAQRVGLIAQFTALADDPEVRVIVLTGAGRAFCAGQDQRESAAMDAKGAVARIDTYLDLYDAMRRTYKPIIAQVQGFAAGAGLQLALLSDIRIAANTAKFGMTEFNIGSAAITGSFLLKQVVGEVAMRRMVLYSDFVPADEALRLNLVHEVVAPEKLAARVAELASSMAARPVSGIRLTKAWWRTMTQADFELCREHTHASHAENYAGGHLTEGAKRFVAGERH